MPSPMLSDSTILGEQVRAATFVKGLFGLFRSIVFSTGTWQITGGHTKELSQAQSTVMDASHVGFR